MGLSEFLQQCRLQKAEGLLTNGDICIYEVALELGFSADAYFTNWFKKQTGITPTEYREQLQHNKD
jgi:two-component system, response regulator YesN